MDLLERQASQKDHPIAKVSGYTLETPMLTAVRGKLFEWIELKKSGLAFPGASRAGKTYASRALLAEIHHCFPHVFAVRISMEAEKRTNSHDRTFGECLAQLNRPLAMNMKRRCVDALAHYLLCQCKDRNASQCVLLLDEAQKLHVLQWEGIGVLLNRLEDSNVALGVFSFGNEHLRTESNLISEVGTEGVIGRFFVQTHDFLGVQSAADLQAILKQYDQMWHPAPEWSFTRFFAQRAHDDYAWRLENEALSLWNELEAHFGAVDRGIPMQWITDPVHYMLKALLNCTQDEDAAADARAQVKQDPTTGFQKPVSWKIAVESVCPASI